MTKHTEKSVIFPTFGSFPNVLSVGQSNKVKSDISNKKILFILDCTGSMGEYINEKNKNSKMNIAKEIIKKVVASNIVSDYDIMQFNEKPYPLCKMDGINEPNHSTYFSPLVPELKKMMVSKNEYCSVIFMSDGLPSEDQTLARESIKMIGTLTRENNSNPVAVAIGVDADGDACSLFAGNRGYNCFIKYEEDIEMVSADIINGINCNYHVLENGQYVPVEFDNNYYYVSDLNNDFSELFTIKPTYFLVDKYLTLVIMKYINDKNKIELLKSHVNLIVNLLNDDDEKEKLKNKFHKLLTMVKHTLINSGFTPSSRSQAAQAYRSNTGGQI
jgi:hypothetical protein